MYNLGSLYEYQDKYIEAEKMFNSVRAKVFLRNLDLHFESLRSLLRIRPYLQQNEDYDMVYVIEMLAVSSALNNPNYLSLAWFHFSNYILRRMNSIDGAIYAYKKAVEYGRLFNENNIDISNEILDMSFDELSLGQSNVIIEGLITLLAAQGRLSEAERAMVIQKENEVFRFSRDKKSSYLTNLSYTHFEEEQGKKINKAIGNLVSSISEAVKSIDSNEANSSSSLESILTEVNEDFISYSKDLFGTVLEFNGNSNLSNHNGDISETQQFLRGLDSNTVALFISYNNATCRVISLTATERKLYSSKINTFKLGRKIAQFRVALQDVKHDPKMLGKELYDIIMPVGLQEDLRKIQNVSTEEPLMLMLHLDDTLRYLPFAALHDGDDYLVKKYKFSYFTSYSFQHMNAKPTEKPKVLALGVSQEQVIGDDVFVALDHVSSELDAIVKTGDGDKRGILSGRIYMDENFTWDNMQETLLEKNNDYSVVHIASHFKLDPGSVKNSYLLTGDKEPLSIEKLSDEKEIFRGVDLLTFSACNTAVDSGPGIDGMSYIAHKNGARSVLASLWPVADKSTPLFMSVFYKLRKEESIDKADALRRTQLAFINGEIEGDSIEMYTLRSERERIESRNKDLPEYRFRRTKKYSHPFFWAPFTLIGNWM